MKRGNHHHNNHPYQFLPCHPLIAPIDGEIIFLYNAPSGSLVLVTQGTLGSSPIQSRPLIISYSF